MLSLAAVHLLVTALSLSVSVASGSEVALANTFKNDGEDGQVGVSSWALPQWWWLTAVLPLPQSQPRYHTSHSTTKTASDLATLSEEDSAMSIVLPGEQLGQSEGGNSEVLQATTPAEGRLNKRSHLCRSPRCHRGMTNIIPASEVKQSWRKEYLSVPEALVQFSQVQAEEEVCKDLSVQLYSVDLTEHYLEPLWVRETVHLGMCPSKLQTRHLGENVWPPNVVEIKCLCQRETCSNLGGDFRCQVVRRPVRMWVRHQDQFIPMQEMVSVGCVCAQRISPEGKYVRPSLLS
ncbi:hypothetical protein OTU49_010959 [Cherax quadricarinatus]|uniref:Uncharacterized protein n=3 Tax=Cherax quadricarinatus TaxID=27406 RepID=A0AAW0W7M9_CHEQU